MAKKNNLTTRRNYIAFLVKDEKEDREKKEKERQKREARKAARLEKVKADVAGKENMDVDADETPLTPREQRLKEFYESRKIRKTTRKLVNETTQQKKIRKAAEKRGRKHDLHKFKDMDLDI